MAVHPAKVSRLEERIHTLGENLIDKARQNASKGRVIDRWLLQFMQQLMINERFRVQALRFVDVLPTLTDDSDLVDHLFAYFNTEELPIISSAAVGLQHMRTHPGDKIIAATIRRAIEKIARYYLGGADAEQALATARTYRDRNILVSLDLLGEAVLSEKEAGHYQQTYMDIITALSGKINEWQRMPDLDRAANREMPILNLSIKSSSLYSQITPVDPPSSIRHLAERLRPVFSLAKAQGAFICLDMEHYEYKDIILGCFKSLLMEPDFRDWPDAGIAIQAYLLDTGRDLQELMRWARQRGTPVTVRLVRGAYWDYESIIAEQHQWPCPVWSEKWQTDQNYEHCVKLLLQNIDHVVPAIATHNIRSIALAMALAEESDIPADQFEFQMLYGMSPHMEDTISDAGYRLRLYIPFGELIPGMSYLTRRLLENSASQSLQRMSLQGEDIYAELAAPEIIKEKKGASFAGPERQEIFENEPLHRFTDEKERHAFAAAIANARNESGKKYSLIIDGRKVNTKDIIISVNPAAPSEVIGEVASASISDADQAVKAAIKVFPEWSKQSAESRAGILVNTARLLRQRRDEFAACEILEAGKTWQEADANVAEAIDFLEYYARQALQLGVPGSKNIAGETNHFLYRPRGVGVVVPPWNFPLAILTGMLSATIVTGNTAVLKPSSQTPVIAAKFVALLYEAGLPQRVVQFLPGAGNTVGRYLVQHPEIHLIAFTGSLETGSGIIKMAASLADGQQHFKHVIAEMGGKNAIIIDSDAELDDAVAGTVESAFSYQGQKCSAASRVIVVGDHYEHFLERIAEATRSLKMGRPDLPDVRIGPVISQAAKKDIENAIRKGKQEAGILLERDCSDFDEGYFVGPVIFRDVPPDSFLFQHEIFGPVLAVTQAENFKEAIALANQSCYALTGGLYSRNPEHIELAREKLQVGNFYINRKVTHACVERQPFGGYKLSGLGSKAGGKDYLLHFVTPVTVTENTIRRGYAPGVRQS